MHFIYFNYLTKLFFCTSYNLNSKKKIQQDYWKVGDDPVLQKFPVILYIKDSWQGNIYNQTDRYIIITKLTFLSKILYRWLNTVSSAYYRALVDFVVYVEHLQLPLGLALVLVDVRHDLAQPGQRLGQRRVVRVRLVGVLQYICICYKTNANL